MLALGLGKSYAKTEVGKSFTYMIFLGRQMVLVIGIKLHGIYFQDQNTDQQANNNRTIIEQ